MKGLDLFFDRADLRLLLGWLRQAGGEVCTMDGRELAGEPEDPAFCCVVPKGGSPALEQGKIWIQPTLISEKGLYTPGSLAVSADAPGETAALYRACTRWIRANFHRTWDKAAYVGPSLYESWRTGKVKFHFFVDAKVLDVSPEQFSMEKFASCMARKGFQLMEDGRDIRQAAFPPDLKAACFVIFGPGADRETWLAARREYHWPHSECVFLWRDKKRVRFIADQRVLEAGGNSAGEVFEAVESYLNVTAL